MLRPPPLPRIAARTHTRAPDIYKSAVSGGAFVQTSRPDVGAAEFLAMVRQCGLNRLLQYASWLSALLAVARKDAAVLAAMQGLRQVVYTGVSMNPEDEAWARAHGIPITVRIQSGFDAFLDLYFCRICMERPRQVCAVHSVCAAAVVDVLQHSA